MHLVCYYLYYSCLRTFDPTIPTYFFNSFSCFLHLYYMEMADIHLSNKNIYMYMYKIM